MRSTEQLAERIAAPQSESSGPESEERLRDQDSPGDKADLDQEDPELQVLVDAARIDTTYDVVRPLSVGLAVLWAFFIPFNLMELPEPGRMSVIWHDVAMFFFSVLLYLLVRKRRVAPRLIGFFAFLVACAIASNVLLAYWVTERGFYTYYIGIILIGAGNVILLTRWFAASAGVILVSWALVASQFASIQEFANLAFLQVAAVLVAVTIHLARINFIRRITQLRYRDHIREQDLENALSQAELVRRELDLRVEERTRELQIAYDSLTSQLEEQARLEDERRDLQTELHHAQRLESVGQLAGGVAHDFNNLLTVIGGNIDLVSRKSNRLEDRHKIWLDEARNATLRAVALTSELLAYSRKQPVVFETIDPVQVVGGVRKMIERAAGENITLDLDLKATESCVLGGRGQVEQVIMNLVLNACDAMPLGGELRIELDEVETASKSGQESRADGPFIRLRVIDNGTGVSEEAQQKIFEPFYTTKEIGKGTGLGLSVVHGIVTQHRGFVEVDSSPEKGTTFSVYLPCVPKRDAGPDIAFSVQGESAASGETILVVEDEDAVRRFSETLLEELGYRVLAAENGEHALELVRAYEGEIDLLLTDVVMPGIQGPQLATQLSKIRPHVPVLYVSGYTDPKILVDLDLGDRRAFLQKPFTRDGLQSKIQDLLDWEPAGVTSGV